MELEPAYDSDGIETRMDPDGQSIGDKNQNEKNKT